MRFLRNAYSSPAKIILGASEIDSCSNSLEADDTEPVSKRTAAKSDRRIAGHAMHLFGFCAGSQRFLERCIEIFDTKIDVHRRPVPLVLAHVIAAFCRMGARRLGHQARCRPPTSTMR